MDFCADMVGDELGRLDFFESALAFMAGYGLKSFLIAQSLNQIERGQGPLSIRKGLLRPRRHAPCYVFLASRESKFITGQVLHPNGGNAVGHRTDEHRGHL